MAEILPSKSARAGKGCRATERGFVLKAGKKRTKKVHLFYDVWLPSSEFFATWNRPSGFKVGGWVRGIQYKMNLGLRPREKVI